jgi:hypothetical protein
MMLLRMVPFAERNYNLVELGRPVYFGHPLELAEIAADKSSLMLTREYRMDETPKGERPRFFD